MTTVKAGNIHVVPAVKERKHTTGLPLSQAYSFLPCQRPPSAGVEDQRCERCYEGSVRDDADSPAQNSAGVRVLAGHDRRVTNPTTPEQFIPSGIPTKGVRFNAVDTSKLGRAVPGRALIGEHRGKSQIGQQRKRRRGQSKSEEVATAGQGATRILGVIAEIKKWSQGFPCSLSF